MPNEKSTHQITSDYLNQYVNMQRVVTSVISQPKKDDNGNVIKTTDGNGKQHIEYDWKHQIEYTLDYSNCALSDVMLNCDGAMVIKVANKTRPKGEIAVKQLDGSTIDVRELLTVQRSAKTTEDFINEVASKSDDEYEQILAEIEKRRNANK